MTEDIDKIVDEAIKQLTLYIFKESQSNLIQDGSIDTGNLLRDVNLTPNSIHYKAPYADIINKGRRPGKIDPNVLEGWVRRKLGITNPAANKRVREAIARKIRFRGFEGTMFFDRAVTKARELFKGEI